MSHGLRVFSDAGLTMPVSAIDFTQAENGVSPAESRVVYIGSQAADKKYLDPESPGVAQIALAITDGGAASSPVADNVRIALTSGGLGTATPGASLDLGVEILGGAAHAIPVHVRVDTGVLASGLYSNLQLSTSTTMEVSI